MFTNEHYNELKKEKKHEEILSIFTVFFIVIFMTVNLMANIGDVPGLNKGTDIATTQVTRTMSNISNWGILDILYREIWYRPK